ncbi:putative membrane protein [Alpinimonas psychrophila]|uniref:Putative membrane protein n=1 Tax=Alpinimonas psychrophila TaxID=748908 RepID=A0A7W3JUQ9_9MICO|nr:putative membrane protein [Alpinimonas psychrophila]
MQWVCAIDNLDDMPVKTKTQGATRSLAVAACTVLLGLLLLWLAQPVLPGWACAASHPRVCPAQLLPVRASLISSGLLVALLAIVLVGLLLRPRANRWLSNMSHSAVVAVPVILALTVVAHFHIPQP